MTDDHSPDDSAAARLRHATFRDLYFAERTRRESIRGSIGVPAAAVSFALYAFIGLSGKVSLALLPGHVPTVVMVGVALLGVVLLFASVWRLLMAEWLFVYSEPPDLEELMRLEATVRQSCAADGLDAQATAKAVEQGTRDVLTAGYYVGYQRYVAGNTTSAGHRTWAVRLVFLGLLCLFGAAMLLPVHLAAGGAP